jgi:hypothetical protein
VDCSTTSTRKARWTRRLPNVAPTYAYLVSDLAEHVTGEIYIAAGGFVGRFDRQKPAFLAYRDHRDSAPWSLDELDGFIRGA